MAGAVRPKPKMDSSLNEPYICVTNKLDKIRGRSVIIPDKFFKV
jgi:hypothetical protein